MSGSDACSVDTVIADETSFFNWLQTDQTCPATADVFAGLLSAMSSEGSSTTLSKTSQDVTNLEKRLEQRSIDVKVAQDRANMVKRPEMTANYYDGWFPLNRPLKTSSVPILIAFATMLLMAGMLVFLEFFGLQTRITYFFYNFATPSNDAPFWTMGAFAFVCVAVIIYLFIR